MEEDRCRHCHTPLPDAGPCRRCARVFVEPVSGPRSHTNDRLWLVVRTALGNVLVSIPRYAWEDEIPIVDLTELT